MSHSLHTLIHYLNQNTSRGGDVALTDRQLLERWINQRDPAAFELLLWRHGPMVLNTCRRLLPRREDIEDAFQATFLVLVRKAGSLRSGEALAAWLHRVACRIAGRARAADIRRTSREQPFVDAPSVPHVDSPSLRELNAILDEEIEALPAHYRRALVLCCLEGKSQEEAARLLSRPRGTVSSWLTRGRERLRQRLLRRGIVVSTAGLAAALTPDALASGGMVPLIGSLICMAGAFADCAAVPTGLMSARTLALAEGALRMMFMTKAKIVAAIALVVAVATAGVGTLSHTTRAADDPIPFTDQLPKEVRSIDEPPREVGSGGTFKSLRVRLPGVEEDGIAWGEKAHGLQAGIAFRRGDQETYEVGQSVTFVVYLRNVSDKKIDMSHIETLFDEWMPLVQDAEGRRLAVASGPIQLGRSPVTHRSMGPGQKIALGYSWFRIRPLGWRGEVLGPTCCVDPGRYKVGYTGLPFRLSDDKDISLGTKQVELDIRKRETAKGEGADRKAPFVKKPVLAIVSEPEQPNWYLSTRSFELPIRYESKNQERMHVREFNLLVSWDRGQVWTQMDKKSGTERAFRIEVPADGYYWFIVQRVDDQGRCVPPDPSRVKPDLRICVDTTPPVVHLRAMRDKNTIHLAWSAEDHNLDDKPIRSLEWAAEKDGPGEPILSGPLGNPGKYDWTLPDLPPGISWPSDFYVRVNVRDKAGNDGHAVVYINLGEKQAELGKRKTERAKGKDADKTPLTREKVRSLYQRAEEQLRLAKAKAIQLQHRATDAEMEADRQAWISAAEQLTKLETLIYDPETASFLSDKQRDEIPFTIAECYFNLKQYEKSVQKYEEIAKTRINKSQGLRALGETIRCFASMGDYMRSKERAKEIRDRIRTIDGLSEDERQQWLKWLAMIDKSKH